jgi:inward rectifier potassium channel
MASSSKPQKSKPEARKPAGAAARVRAVGVERAPYKDLYHFVLSRSWPEFFVLVTLGFLLVNTVFALLYLVQPGSVANARPGSFEDAFYFSVQTLATIGYGGMYPASRFAHLVVTFEALTGIMSVAVITGITFTRFSRPTARVLFADKIVMAPRDGVPHLMFRLANWRRNQIVEARLNVMLLVTERTREGEMMRRQIDLALVRDRTAVFFLSWTAMHVVDERSPFHGPGAIDRLREQKAEIFVGLSGIDETIGQMINVRRGYNIDDVVPNARFADVLTLHPDGTREIDYRKFHDTIPLGGEATAQNPGPDPDGSTSEGRRAAR